MSEKLVHVNAYTKRDGTEVREHYRGGIGTPIVPYNDETVNPNGGIAGKEPTTPFNTTILEWLGIWDLLKGPFETPHKQNLVLDGGISMNVPAGGIGDVLGPAGEAIQAIGLIVQVGGQLALQGIQIAKSIKDAIKNFDNSVDFYYLMPKLGDTVGELRQGYTKSKELETSTLDKLANTKDQRAYEQLYQSYLKQREHNKQINHILNRVEYALQQKDYDGVANELQNYQTIQEEGMKNLTQEWSKTQLQPTIPDATDYPMPQPLTPSKSFDWDELRRTGLHKYPKIQKALIDVAMERYILPKYNAYDANELWRAASYNFEQSAQYVKLNAYFVSSISNLPREFREIVREKVKQQFSLNDTKGILFRPESNLSYQIGESPEFKDYIRMNKQALLEGSNISGSLRFKSSKNLHYSLGIADILDTYINQNGDIVSYILDTYEFNANDPDWKVEWARNVQENKLLTPFYTLNVIIIPFEKWFRWL